MATTVLVPVSEYNKTYWSGSYTAIDEGSTPNDSDYISHNSVINYAHVDYHMTNMPTNAVTTRLDWVFRMRDIDGDPGSYGVLYPTMTIARGPSSYYGPFTSADSWGNHTAYSTDTGWSEAEVNAMTMHLWGIGAPKGPLYVSNVYCTATYTIVDPSFDKVINDVSSYSYINDIAVADITAWNDVS